MASHRVRALHVGASGYIADVCRQLSIAKTINRLVTWDEVQCKRSPGTLAVALIVNILVQRRPLYRVWESYQRLDLPTLFDERVQLEDLNDDAFGRTLDRLHASNQLRLLVHSVALSAVRQLPLGIRSIHADTTSIALAGAYERTASDQHFVQEHPDRSLLDITYGYSKDHRPDLKQFVYGLVVSGEGLPLLGTVENGNTSDKTWNSETLDAIQTSFLDPHTLVYVADSALVTPDNLEQMRAHKIRFVSRFPETYRLAEELKEKAWAENRWELVGRLSQSEKGAVYHAQSFPAELKGHPYRFVVVHSTALDQRKAKALERRIEREKAGIEKACKPLEKERFHCEADAQRVLEAFLKEHGQGLHPVTGRVVAEEVVKRPPGRPAKGAAPPKVTQYRIALAVEAPPKEVVDEAHARDCTFILITNLMDEKEWSNAQLLEEYKGQVAVETRFRNLKADPCIVDHIYVKSSRRAEALAYLFLLALIVASFIEIKIRQELKARREKFMMPGKRLTDRPTMAGIFDVMQSVVVVLVQTDHGVERLLPANTDPRVAQILELTGLDERSYTQVRARA